MSNFLRPSNGSVSVYMMIVMSALIFFNALFIDFLRMRTAEAESELAVKTAVQSVMSAYDRKLIPYGLFGLTVDIPTQKEIAEKTLKNNLHSADSGKFSFSDPVYRSDSVQLVPIHRLANVKVFERQILEDMKYRTPIEWTRIFVQKLSPAAPISEAGDQFVKKASAVDTLISERESTIKRAWHIVDDMRDLLESTYAQNQRMLEQLSSIEAVPDFIEVNLPEGSSANSTNSPTTAMPKQVVDQRQQKKEQTAVWLAQAKSKTDGWNTALLQLYKKFEAEWDRAREKDDRLAEELGKQDASANSAAPADSVFNHVIVLGSDYFIANKTKVAQFVSLPGPYANAVSVSADSLSGTEHLTGLNEVFHQNYTAQYNNLNAEERKRRQAYDKAEEEQKQQKEKAQKKLEEAKRKAKQSACSESFAAQYEALYGKGADSGIVEKYIKYNQGDEKAEETEQDILVEAESTGKQSISGWNAMLKLGSAVRNELFVDEYLLTHFNYRTIQSDLSKSKGIEPSLANPSQHPLERQEIEYLIYGLSSCTANSAAAYAEIYATRLAIRTIEALLEPKNAASGMPMLVFFTALAEGAVKAYEDTEKLIGGEEVPLMKKFPSAGLTYKDYLRTFLITHGGNTKILNRTQALIALNTGIDLTQSTVELRLNASSSIRPLFLPAIAKAINRLDFMEGAFADGRFTMDRTAYYAY